MKKIFLFAFAMLVLSANSCKKPDNNPKGDLKITFKAFYDTNPLVVFTDYQTADGDNLQVHVLNYFLSNIELIKENDEVVRLKDIDFVDFNGCTDLTKANAGVTLTFPGIAAGNYKAIRFGIGVEPVQNAKEPGDFSTDPYLGDPGNYWTAWNSYIFSRTEGRIDTLPGAAGGDVSYLYHTGVDGMYQARSFTKTFTLETNAATELQFHLNVKNVFYKTGSEINIAASNVSHSGAVGTPLYNLAKSVIINIADALTLQ
jgi:hypothetical protein